MKNVADYFARFAEQDEAARLNKERFDRAVEAACKAHWASWGRMFPPNERKHYAAMERAVAAALAEYLP